MKPNLIGSIVTNDFTLFHHNNSCGKGECFFEAMFGQNDGNAKLTVDFAKEHGKLAAVTETGHEGLKDPKWWTEVLYPAIKDYPVSYVLTWRNACDQPTHYYAPFPGQESAEDFKTFAELIIML